MNREFPPVGKYRIRLLQEVKPNGDVGEASLDIREYISDEKFEGFTRRGIRIGDRAQLDLLRDILKEAMDASVW